MANVLIEESTLTAIANSIRSATGTTDKMLMSKVAGKVNALANEKSSLNSQLIATRSERDSLKDEVNSLTAEIDGYTSKNLLDCSGLVEETVNNITYTPVYDEQNRLEYVEVNGTIYGNSEYEIGVANLVIGDEYYVSTCYDETVLQITYKDTTGRTKYFTSGSFIAEVATLNFNIYAGGGGTKIDGVKIYPLICKADIEDKTYEPYGMVGGLKDEVNTLEGEVTSLEGQVSTLTTDKANLTTQVSTLTTQKTNLEGQVSSLTADKSNLTNQVKRLDTEINGRQQSKNLLDCSGLVEETINNMRFTPTYDDEELLQYIEVNGTIYGSADYKIGVVDLVVGESYYVSDGNDKSYPCILYKDSSSNNTKAFSNTGIYTATEASIEIYVNVGGGGSVHNGSKVYPLICKADVEDKTYEPYFTPVVGLKDKIPPNGKVWTQVDKFMGVTFNDICNANGIWVACGGNGLYYSTDGINWTKSDVTSSSGEFTVVHYANGMWVACSGKETYYSTDGMNWTKSASNAGSDFTDIHYGNGIWVGCTGNLLCHSSNGSTFTPCSNTSGISFNAVHYANGMWVACANDLLYFSTNGKTWTQGNVASDSFYAVHYANGIWVACGGNGLYYSTDGMSWIKGNSVGGSFYAIHNANGIWVAGKSSDPSGIGLYYSTDGKNWYASNAKGQFIDVHYANGMWVAPCKSSKGLYYSTDGKTWTRSNIADGRSFNAVYNADGIWVACGNTIGLYYSKSAIE